MKQSLITLSIVAAALFAQVLTLHSYGMSPNGKWVRIDTVITYSTNQSLDNAKQETLSLCRRAAIEKAIPQTIQVFSHSASYQYERKNGEIEDNFMLSSFIVSSNMGYIVDERIEGLPIVDYNSGSFKYKMRFEAKVVPIEGVRNPSIRLKLSTPHNLLYHGDSLILSAKSTVKGYLYIFHIFEDNSVELLYPSRFMKDNQLEANEEKHIPDSEELTIRVASEPGKEMMAETFFGVLSVNKIPQLDEHLEVGEEARSTAGDLSYLSFQRWLSEIPLSQRSEAILQIKILSN